MYKSMAVIDGGLRSIYDESPYVIGVTRSERAKPDHAGGLYCYRRAAQALATAVPGGSRNIHAPRVIVEVRTLGSYQYYAGGKIAASKMTPIRILPAEEIARIATKIDAKQKTRAVKRHLKTKLVRRAEWIRARASEIDAAREEVKCPVSCRASCKNGATCQTQSGSGWGFWVRAFWLAAVKCEPTSYWSGSNPTPSTSINRGVAEYLRANAPKELIGSPREDV